jgi:hypothetical protein
MVSLPKTAAPLEESQRHETRVKVDAPFIATNVSEGSSYGSSKAKRN